MARPMPSDHTETALFFWAFLRVSVPSILAQWAIGRYVSVPTASPCQGTEITGPRVRAKWLTMKVRRETAIIMETVMRIMIKQIMIKRILDPTITLTMDLLNRPIPDQIVYRTIELQIELATGRIPGQIPVRIQGQIPVRIQEPIMQQIPERPIDLMINLLTEPIP